MNPLDDLEDQLREEQSKAGYGEGFELGKKSGQEEGYARGLEEGSKIGSELGNIMGHTLTWIQIVQLKNETSSRTMDKLHEVLGLVKSFPKTNENSCEKQLDVIRSKFKVTKSLMNLC